jgi:pimeloyl-ACP methyl ester carboxylesterase
MRCARSSRSCPTRAAGSAVSRRCACTRRSCVAHRASGLPRDSQDIRALAGASFDRGHDVDGPGRQLAAIIASGDRTAELRTIAALTLVIHGTADPLVSPSGGRATARAIPGAQLLSIEGMGHDLPRAAWPQILDAIVGHAHAADSAAAARPLAAEPSFSADLR